MSDAPRLSGGADLAYQQMAAQLKAAVHLPIADTSLSSPEDLGGLMRDLDRLKYQLEDAAEMAVVRDRTGIRYPTPVGVILGAVGEWVDAQRNAVAATLMAMAPADRLQQHERLAALLQYFAGQDRPEIAAVLGQYTDWLNEHR